MTITPLDKSTFMEQMSRAEQAGDVSLGAVEQFWNWAYSDDGGVVQTCAFPVPTEDKDADDMGKGQWIHAESYSDFKEFCETYSGMWRYHIYSGVNTLDEKPETGRGGASYINRVNHLSFDIEVERDSYAGSTEQEVWWCYRYALAQAKYMNEEYGVWPMIVMSENGIHMHFKVDFEVNDGNMVGKSHVCTKFMTHQSMNSSYAKTVENDAPDYINFAQDDVSDIPRVMKVPGTRGIKSENGRLCGIIHCPSKRKAGIITIDDITVPDDAFNSVESRDDADPDSVEVTPEDTSSDVMERVKALCKKEKLFRKLYRGEIVDYDSRSEAEFAFVMKMLNHSFEPHEINQVMWSSGLSKWDEESEHYRERTIQHALDRFDGTKVKDSTNGSFEFNKTL